jgi:hypothetical protein
MSRHGGAGQYVARGLHATLDIHKPGGQLRNTDDSVTELSSLLAEFIRFFAESYTMGGTGTQNSISPS